MDYETCEYDDSLGGWVVYRCNQRSLYRVTDPKPTEQEAWDELERLDKQNPYNKPTYH